jgi:hypothetical protein
VVYCFSDAFAQPREGDVLHNEQGGLHFRFVFADGSISVDNPHLRDEHGVPLYALDGEIVRMRSPEELEADRLEAEARAVHPAGAVPGSIESLEARVKDVEEALDILMGEHDDEL